MVFTTRFQSFETRQTLNGRAAWSQAGAESSEVVAADSAQVTGLRSGFDADPGHVLLAGSRPGAHPAFEGQTRLLGRMADVVRLDVPGLPRRRYYFDAENHRMLAMDEAAPSAVGGNSRRIFSDFKTTDGVLWPMSEERQVAGSRILMLSLRSVAFDRGVPDALFQRPAALDKPFIRMK